MPKKQPPVTVKFQKAAVTPSKRTKKPTEIKQRPKKKKHDLNSYVKENEDSGLSILELIHQYRDYECEHKNEVVTGSTSKFLTIRCNDCWRVRNQRRSGVLKHET